MHLGKDIERERGGGRLEAKRKNHLSVLFHIYTHTHATYTHFSFVTNFSLTIGESCPTEAPERYNNLCSSK